MSGSREMRLFRASVSVSQRRRWTQRNDPLRWARHNVLNASTIRSSELSSSSPSSSSHSFEIKSWSNRSDPSAGTWKSERWSGTFISEIWKERPAAEVVANWYNKAVDWYAHHNNVVILVLYCIRWWTYCQEMLGMRVRLKWRRPFPVHKSRREKLLLLPR